MVKIIKTSEEYEQALLELERLMDLDPEPSTPTADKLETLTALIELYESKAFDIPLPDPIEAIRFRMEQQNLKPNDLIPYLGSRSRVSEVLARKRPLSINMIRKLHEGLGIPASVLIQETELEAQQEPTIDWQRFPIRELIKRRWINASVSDGLERITAVLRNFIEPLGLQRVKAALYRQSINIRTAESVDKYALTAWAARVMQRALADPPPVEYRPNTVNMSFMQQVARLSSQESGPLAARDYLNKHGISLIIESHLPHTYLDGAALLSTGAHPVIGLTLRHDRLDSFWYTLMHELAHIALHSNDEEVVEFFDDFGADPYVTYQNDVREQEADELAREILIPEDAWKRSGAAYIKGPDAAVRLAEKLQIHPAIVAGRMRHQFKAWQLLNNLIGHGEVRRLFPEVSWNG